MQILFFIIFFTTLAIGIITVVFGNILRVKTIVKDIKTIDIGKNIFQLNKTMQNSAETNKTKKCEYCGSVMEENCNECKSCGAKSLK